MSTDTLVPVYEADSKAEAAIIEGILKQGGVECTVKAMNGESLQVLVKSGQSDQAEQIILDYRSPDDQY
jgi:hypothetical protein